MKELQPIPEASLSPVDMSPVFDATELGYHLAATPNRRLHETFGESYHYSLGPDTEHPSADLTVYPDAKMIRLTSEGMSIAMRSDTMGAVYSDDGVSFSDRTEREYRHLTIGSRGEVTLFVCPQRDETLIQAPTQTEVSPSNTTPTPEQQTNPEKGDRVVVVGRAGRDPRVAETKTGVLVAKFPLAEKAEERTLWHNVVAFRDRAQEVSEKVKKGDEIKVVGFRHTRKDNRGKDITEIYAASVKPPSKKREDN
jgi:hypothetical protein